MPYTVERIFVHKIHLENFKSYAGKVTIGPFHPSFTCIIGPNGSGKSNIIDAMQFVFGKNARKLRLASLSEVIHNSHGTLEHNAVRKARVDVVFRKVREVFPDRDESSSSGVEGDGDGSGQAEAESGHNSNSPLSCELDAHYSLTVSREVNRDGTSKYMLNNEASTWGYVHKKLLEVRVDLEHNRFLILQGEVELISQMKPKAETANDEGLLEYLEDIIGSNQYVEPIAAKHQQVESTSDDLSIRLGRVKASEKERAALEAPRRAAEIYAFSAADLSHAKAASE